jgi:rhamnosyltransferase
MNTKINILMATYNGEKYIAEQIDSIINQSYENWNLLIRDDVSNDNTLNIIKQYSNVDSRIKVISDNKGNLGIVKNFEELLKHSNSEYVMFSDQDDVWLENKIQVIFSSMLKLKEKHVEGSPLLVHSDSYIVDDNLNIISSNFIGKRGNEKGVDKILFAPCVQGASMMINKFLKNIVLPFPEKINIHDYYISVVNELIGKRSFIESPLMYYRQHSKNEIGVNNSLLFKIKKLLKRDFYLSSLEEKLTVKTIYNKFYGKINDKDRDIIEKYFYIANKNNLFKKIFYVFKNNFRATDGQVALIFKILFTKELNDIENINFQKGEK